MSKHRIQVVFVSACEWEQRNELTSTTLCVGYLPSGVDQSSYNLLQSSVFTAFKGSPNFYVQRNAETDLTKIFIKEYIKCVIDFHPHFLFYLTFNTKKLPVVNFKWACLIKIRCSKVLTWNSALDQVNSSADDLSYPNRCPVNIKWELSR